MKRQTLLTLLWLFSSACASQSTAVNPDEMSAEEHRREVEKERQQAREHEARYNPNAAAPVAASEVAAGGTSDMARVLPLENPTEQHLRDAEQHRAHARSHERAAAELERSEAVECKTVPAKERGACPILGPAVSLTDVPTGVRVQLSSNVNVDTLLAEMRCHWAYARARGWKGDTVCPLYLREARFQKSADGLAVEIVTPNKALVPELRRLAREEAVLAPKP